jgi:hypothetical protein
MCGLKFISDQLNLVKLAQNHLAYKSQNAEDEPFIGHSCTEFRYISFVCIEPTLPPLLWAANAAARSKMYLKDSSASILICKFLVTTKVKRPNKSL